MSAQLSEELVWSEIVARSWCDDQFKNRLLADPRGVLAEHNLEVPPGTEVEVVPGDEVKVTGAGPVRQYVLPDRPPCELHDDELAGGAYAYCYSAACARCGACACRCRC